MPSNPAFPPLNNPRETRIIDLQPSAGFEDSLHFTFDIVNLEQEEDHRRSFEALSYAWGSPEPVDSAWTGTHQIAINANLRAALRRLRSRDRVRTLWVDAICIDQTDLEEKSAQVALMSLIYSQAQRTIAYLGEEDGAEGTESENALGVLSKIYESHTSKGVPAIHGQVTDAMEFLKRDADTTLNLETWDILSVESNHMRLVALYGRPWFSRLWVVQEVILSRSTLFLFGPGEMDLEMFLNATRFLLHGPGINLGDAAIVAMRQIIWLQVIRHTRQGYQHLMELVLSLRNAACADPRDRIYGVLGMCDVGIQKSIPIDYTMDPTELMKKAVRYMYDETPYPYMLFAQVETRAVVEKRLPTWMPDFEFPFSFFPLADANRYAAEETRKPYVVISGDTMLLQGKRVDTVEEILRIADYETAETVVESSIPPSILKDFTKNHLIFDSALKLANQARDPYLTDRSRISCLPYILMSGIDFNTLTKSSPEEMDSYFGAALQIHQEVTQLLAEGLSPAQIFESVTDLFSLEFTKRYNQFDAQMKYLGNYDNRCLALTTAGMLSWVPSNAQPGDYIYVLAGSDCCHVFRPCGTQYQLLGECYQYGFMNGEAAQMEGLEWEEMVVV